MCLQMVESESLAFVRCRCWRSHGPLRSAPGLFAHPRAVPRSVTVEACRAAHALNNGAGPRADRRPASAKSSAQVTDVAAQGSEASEFASTRRRGARLRLAPQLLGLAPATDVAARRAQADERVDPLLRQSWPLRVRLRSRSRPARNRPSRTRWLRSRSGRGRRPSDRRARETMPRPASGRRGPSTDRPRSAPVARPGTGPTDRRSAAFGASLSSHERSESNRQLSVTSSPLRETTASASPGSLAAK